MAGKITTPRSRRRIVPLEELIFRRGGVAGAVRRIVYRKRHSFTPGEIQAALYRQHPQLTPASDQVTTIIEHLARRRILRLVGENWRGKVFVRNPKLEQSLTLKQQLLNL